jgi:hypothetical protein
VKPVWLDHRAREASLARITASEPTHAREVGGRVRGLGGNRTKIDIYTEISKSPEMSLASGVPTASTRVITL